MTNTINTVHSPDSSTAAGGARQVIIVGLDGSPSSWDAFAWAVGEVRRAGGQLVAVYVTPTAVPGAEFGAPIDYAALAEARDQIVTQLKKEAEERAHACSVPMTFVREVGDPAHALTRVSHTMRANLIVVGKSSKILHHVAGSLGRKLVSRHGGPPIVVVP